MQDFDQCMNEWQTNWRKDNIKNDEWGEQKGEQRPWILPRDLWAEGLWHYMKASLPGYLQRSKIQKHDGVHNLKSSWMLCANLYFPFRQDTEMLARFLTEKVSPLIDTVDSIELEWAGRPPLDPTTLLGEPHGQRGRNQTSPDVAFTINGGTGIVLTENKFTEHSFYACSGRNKKYGNPERQRCMNIRQVYADIPNQCYMLQWDKGERTNRKYWDFIKLTDEGLASLKRCPASTSGYQLFRQQALAEALAQSGKYDLVINCIAHDARNETLIQCLHGTGVDDFRTGWGPLFEGKAQFASFTHQQWVDWVGTHDSNNKWKDWLAYVNSRYGL